MDDELRFAYALASAESRSELFDIVIAWMREKLGASYLQVWLADGEDAPTALLLLEERGNSGGGVAGELFRLGRGQGLAGKSWAEGRPIAIDARDPNELRVAAAPSFVKREGLELIQAVTLGGRRDGVALAASRNDEGRFEDEDVQAFRRLASLALDRCISLQLADAAQGYTYVTHALQSGVTEGGMLEGVIDRFRKIVPYDWAVFLRIGLSSGDLVPTCSVPPGVAGRNREPSTLVESLLAGKGPLRTYRMGSVAESWSSYPQASTSDLADLLDGCPADVADGGHALVVALDLAEIGVLDLLSQNSSVMGLVVLGRTHGHPGFTHIEESVVVDTLSVLAPAISCMRALDRERSLFGAAADVVAAPNLADIRSQVLGTLSDLFGAPDATYISLNTLALMPGGGNQGERPETAHRAADRLATVAEHGDSLRVQAQQESVIAPSRDEAVEVLVFVRRFGIALGAVRLEVDAGLDIGPTIERLAVLLADHLALAESEGFLQQEAVHGRLARTSLYWTAEVGNSLIRDSLEAIDGLAELAFSGASRDSVASLRRQAIDALLEARGGLRLMHQVGLGTTPSVGPYLEDLSAAGVLRWCMTFAARGGLHLQVQPGVDGDPLPPGTAQTLGRYAVAVLDAARRSASGTVEVSSVVHRGEGRDPTVEFTASWRPRAAVEPPVSSLIGRTFGLDDRSQPVALEQFEDASGRTVLRFRVEPER